MLLAAHCAFGGLTLKSVENHVQTLCHMDYCFEATRNYAKTREFHAFCVKFVSELKTRVDAEQGKSGAYFLSLSSDWEMRLGRGK